MKKQILTLIALFFFALCLNAQNIPIGMKYQAVARDAKGEVLADQKISLKITLRSGGMDGEALYTEIHRVKSNKLGLFDLVIGQGDHVERSLEEIPWADTQVWLEVAIDESGGNKFVSLGATQLLAVPYAFHAGSADKLAQKNIAHEKAGGSGNTWKVGGNRFNVPGPHNFGTLDADDLVFITDNITRMIITAAGEVQIAGDLDVDGKGTMGTLEVEGDVDLNTISGTTDIEGPTTINNTLTVGSTSTNRTTTLNGQVTIDADITGGSDDDVAQYPLLVKGGDHGIAIQANGDIGSILNAGDIDRSTNFLTCFDEQGDPCGRIEGFHVGNEFTAVAGGFDALTGLIADDPDTEQPSLIDILLGGNISESDAIDDAEATAIDESGNSAVVALVNAASDFNSDFGVGIVSGTLDIANSFLGMLADIPGCAALVGCDDLIVGVINLVHSVLQLGLHVGYFSINPGVAFESGGADYAEWLEKANPTEAIINGEVVGVKGGLISKKFTDADRYMVVSLNPTVIGAMPKSDEEHRFEKIAFMGASTCKSNWGSP